MKVTTAARAVEESATSSPDPPTRPATEYPGHPVAKRDAACPMWLATRTPSPAIRCGWAASRACRREPTAASGRFVDGPCAKCQDSAASTAAAASHASSASGRQGRGMSGCGEAVTASSSTGDDERVLRTWLTERFDLQVPVVSAPMAGVSGGALAGAVSAAGGLRGGAPGSHRRPSGSAVRAIYWAIHSRSRPRVPPRA